MSAGGLRCDWDSLSDAPAVDWRLVHCRADNHSDAQSGWRADTSEKVALSTQEALQMSLYFSEVELRNMAEEFDVNGFLRVEDALNNEQIERFNSAVDRHFNAFPGDWIELSESFCEGTNVLPHTADFDEAIENPKTLEMLRAIIGEEITFLEGVGKRPPDLDPELPLSQVIKEVQRRAKIKMRA